MAIAIWLLLRFFQRKAEWFGWRRGTPISLRGSEDREQSGLREHTAMQGALIHGLRRTLPELLARREEILKAEQEAKSRQPGVKATLDVLVR